MKSLENNSNSAENTEVFESTNPFQNRNMSAENSQSQSSRPGKRPRIQRPIYSARLS